MRPLPFLRESSGRHIVGTSSPHVDASHDAKAGADSSSSRSISFCLLSVHALRTLAAWPENRLGSKGIFGNLEILPTCARDSFLSFSMRESLGSGEILIFLPSPRSEMPEGVREKRRLARVREVSHGTRANSGSTLGTPFAHFRIRFAHTLTVSLSLSSLLPREREKNAPVDPFESLPRSP